MSKAAEPVNKTDKSLKKPVVKKAVSKVATTKIPEYPTEPVTASPVGWRIMIEDHRPADETDGGIILPDESKSHAAYLNYVGKVIELGPECYKHPKFQGGEPWCKEGDYIVFGRYAGQRIKFKGADTGYRFVNDDEVLAVISDPDLIIVYV